MTRIPQSSYGAFNKPKLSSIRSRQFVETFYEQGYAVINSKISSNELSFLSKSFDEMHNNYVKKYGKDNLQAISEIDVVRMPLIHNKIFLELVFNKNIISLVSKLIEGNFILNQQNGVINRPGEDYSQLNWHRDLPYQHFTTSKPIAISCLFCIDDFTKKNGATHVLPGSHNEEWFPSSEEIHNRSIQIEAEKGNYIIINSMCYHSGGFNESKSSRRGINHVFSIPFIKPQINFPDTIKEDLSTYQKQILGFQNKIPSSIEDFFELKINKK